MSIDNVKKRKPRPWIAALLSFLDAPLGFLYAGRPRLAVRWWIMIWACYFSVSLVIATGWLNATALWTLLGVFALLRLLTSPHAYRTALQAPEAEAHWWQRWYALIAAFLLSMLLSETFILFSKSAVLGSYAVPGQAMAPTINHDDRIFVDHLFAHPAQVSRGDLGVFVAQGSGSSYRFVSRVVGLPGDVIELKNNALKVNGRIVTESYASYQESPYAPPDQSERTIPMGFLYVLGDNRNFSNDSRVMGPLPYENYVGRPTNIYYSRKNQVLTDEWGGRDYQLGAIAWERLGRNLTH